MAVLKSEHERRIKRDGVASAVVRCGGSVVSE